MVMGLEMRTRDRFWKVLATIGRFGAPQALPRFNCCDCERNAQCGLPPHDDCIHRIMQIARDGDFPRRPNYLYPAIWPR
jgi:hypothetical protein